MPPSSSTALYVGDIKFCPNYQTSKFAILVNVHGLCLHLKESHANICFLCLPCSISFVLLSSTGPIVGYPSKTTFPYKFSTAMSCWCECLHFLKIFFILTYQGENQTQLPTSMVKKDTPYLPETRRDVSPQTLCAPLYFRETIIVKPWLHPVTTAFLFYPGKLLQYTCLHYDVTKMYIFTQRHTAHKRQDKRKNSTGTNEQNSTCLHPEPGVHSGLRVSHTILRNKLVLKNFVHINKTLLYHIFGFSSFRIQIQ